METVVAKGKGREKWLQINTKGKEGKRKGKGQKQTKQNVNGRVCDD